MNFPTGTVTFLFTDIEGSTKLAQEHAAEMTALLARHQAILRKAIEVQDGYLFRTVGDAFFVAFDTAISALNAALAAERSLHSEAWSPAPIKVRMGIHTGAAQLADDASIEGPYSGYATLALTQRVMSAAHGGQILLSQATRDLIWEQLPADVTLLDMGEHRLKDVLRPIRLYQATLPDLPAVFPALNTLSAIPNNLLVQLTSFIGRERELSEVRDLLAGTHLLTLTGPGGTGKTRLSLQLAAEILTEFANGAWLVELAPLADPALVAQTIASTLGVREQPGRTVLEALTDYLRAKDLLLILDNCEHLIESCAQVTNSLLRAAPRLKILATSREALGIAGETAYRVPSLPLPDPRQLHDLDALEQNDCVRLFVDRARAASPSFHLKEKNATAIAEICRRLDGIPLAIELASARTKVLPPEEIAARLDDRFRLLTGGSRTALERHQTLFALIEWSHNLLSESERVLLRRLSVFAGGWSFEAAQAVCGERPYEEVLDLLTHLVDKSLVAVDEQAREARYRLPETIRQYARDKLYESGQAEMIRGRHLDFFLRFAEGAEPKLRSGEQLEWLERLETEHDNLRTALGWSLESGKSDCALRLAGTLSYFWVLRGYFSESQRWLDDALALSEREQRRGASGEKYPRTPTEKAQRAKALFGATWSQMGIMDLEKAHKTVEESLQLWRELGDKWWLAVTLGLAGLIIVSESDVQTAVARDEEAVALARELDDPWPLALCLVRLGDDLKVEGTDMAAARRCLEEGVALARRIGDKSVLSEGLRELGSAYYGEGNLTAAARAIEEALAEARAIGSIFSILLALAESVIISCLQDNRAKANDYCFELWAIGREMGALMATGFALLGFGLAASFGGEPGEGVRLVAATETMFRERGVNITVGDSPMIKVLKQALGKAQAQLGPAAFQAAWAEGQQMTLEQAIALATKNEGKEQA